MDTPKLSDKIKSLKREIHPYGPPEPFKLNKVYVIIPIIISILLFIIKPPFVKESKIIQKNKTTRIFSFQKYILSVLMISLIFMGSYYYIRENYF